MRRSYPKIYDIVVILLLSTLSLTLGACSIAPQATNDPDMQAEQIGEESLNLVGSQVELISDSSASSLSLEIGSTSSISSAEETIPEAEGSSAIEQENTDQAVDKSSEDAAPANETAQVVDKSVNSTTAVDSTPPTITATSIDGAPFMLSFATITITFSEDMKDPAGDSGVNDVTNPNNYLLVGPGEDEAFDTLSCDEGVDKDDDAVTVNSVTYDSSTYQATLNIHHGSVLPNGKYRLYMCGTTTLQDINGLALNGGKDTIRGFKINTKSPEVKSTNLAYSPFTTAFSKITITFDEDVYDPDGNYDENDVTNPYNYLLVSAGENGIINTTTCWEGASADDVAINLDTLIDPTYEIYSVQYDSDTYTTTLIANGAENLANGRYRLLVCGAGEYYITDVHMNALNAGADYSIDFKVNTNLADSSLPATGFTPGAQTVLPQQPEALAYQTYSDLWLEIPALGAAADIVGVPQEGDGWDVGWLGEQVGWLEGSAFPLWEGNTVLTGHSTNADGLAGVFAQLDTLKYGDTIVVHAYGESYTFEVRSSDLIYDWQTGKVFQHQDYNWVTLISCEGWDNTAGEYQYRRMVRAVLVSVSAD